VAAIARLPSRVVSFPVGRWRISGAGGLRARRGLGASLGLPREPAAAYPGLRHAFLLPRTRPNVNIPLSQRVVVR